MDFEVCFGVLWGIIFRKIVIWTMLAEAWVTFGGLGGSLEGLGLILNGLWAPF